jgi:hypothetical protein
MVHIAKSLKEKGEMDGAFAFVAYYDKWRKYLEEQNHVPIKMTFGTRDIFQKMSTERLDYSELERIEEKYGNKEIWNIIYTEGKLTPHTHTKYIGYKKYSKEDILLYCQTCFRYFEHIFEKYKPDCIIDFARVCIFRGVLDRVAEYNNIPYLYPYNAILGDQVGDRYCINRRTTENYEFIRKQYNSLLKNPESIKEGWNYLSRFREGESKSIYNLWTANPEKKKSDSKSSSIRAILRIMRWFVNTARTLKEEYFLRLKSRSNPEIRYNFQLFKSLPFTKLPSSILSAFRKMYLRYYFPVHKGSIAHKYAFMTLHLQPEASTSMLAPYHVNQVAVIENISRALPLDWKLVVKPNKSMIGIDSINFFRHLKQIPNLIVTDYYANTRELIENASAVIAISGTSGLEAVLSGKMVILLGNEGIIWHCMDDVIKCTEWPKLHKILKTAGQYKANDQRLAAYLQAVHDNTFGMEASYTWEGPYDLSHEGYGKAVEVIAEQLIQTFNDETDLS